VRAPERQPARLLATSRRPQSARDRRSCHSCIRGKQERSADCSTRPTSTRSTRSYEASPPRHKARPLLVARRGSEALDAC